MTPEPTVYPDGLSREIEPSDPGREQELGRVALWLDRKTYGGCLRIASVRRMLRRSRRSAAAASDSVRARLCTMLA